MYLHSTLAFCYFFIYSIDFYLLIYVILPYGRLLLDFFITFQLLSLVCTYARIEIVKIKSAVIELRIVQEEWPATY
jgi:hypothetical protein